MVSTKSVIAAAAALFLAVSAAPTPQGESGIYSNSTVPATPVIPAACPNPLVRKEWRSLTTTEKSAYITAVRCLQNTPSIATSVGGAISRFDDFQGIHVLQNDNIHFVGFFLHWHRYMLHEYEKALRNECGYTGAQPYWDWMLDIASGLPMEQWPIFDSVTGFGGNGPYVNATAEQNPFGMVGRTGGGCVPDGPFTVANGFTVNLKKGDPQTTESKCLTRDFMPQVAVDLLHPSAVIELNQQTNFKDFARKMDGLPSFSHPNVHGGGHFSVGGLLGTLGDSYNSPGDPIFYLHHGNVDRLWALWQTVSDDRIMSVGGPLYPFSYDGPQIDHSFEINLGECGISRPLSQLQYTRGPVMCYRYDQ